MVLKLTKSKAHISLWTTLALTNETLPPLHFAVPTCGPKNTASMGPGDIVPRQLSFPLPIHGFVLRGALYIEKNDENIY